jgi:hypothetical protein
VTPVMLRWGTAAAVAVGVAVLAGVADWRRRRRRDLDRVGMVDWRTVQMLSLIVAAMLGTVAMKG